MMRQFYLGSLNVATGLHEERGIRRCLMAGFKRYSKKSFRPFAPASRAKQPAYNGDNHRRMFMFPVFISIVGLIIYPTHLQKFEFL